MMKKKKEKDKKQKEGKRTCLPGIGFDPGFITRYLGVSRWVSRFSFSRGKNQQLAGSAIYKKGDKLSQSGIDQLPCAVIIIIPFESETQLFKRSFYDEAITIFG